MAASHRKGFERIGLWTKSITRHLYHCAATSGGDGELMQAKWLSMLNHIGDVHTGHSEVFPACEHGPLERRKWITQGTDAHDRLATILASKSFLKDFKQLSSEGQTFSVETFHSTLIQFAPKSVAYSYTIMAARTFIAALHYNENSNRKQRKTKDGQPQWKRKYPKAQGGEPVVQELMEDATYNYIDRLLETVLQLERQPTAHCSTSRPVPPPLSQSQPHVPTQELVRKRRQRFSLP
ncbi:uncharacterized protein LOC120838012 [Ixodes scapularis]|uniref:uncharacterized protein LOC120838012 n=1 Tax=Ixodes scapularis TaxID=6945 RepID=UPI001A9FA16C|nr:uncharacterized protein LOC120838012 [Ixodes scapularis]